MMKQIIHYLFLFPLCMAFFACADDNNEPTKGDLKPVTTLLAPLDAASVNLVASTASSISFKWEKSASASSTSVKYALVFDKQGGDFSTPIARIASSSSGSLTSVTVSLSKLNEIWGAAGIPGGEVGTLIWSVITIAGDTEILATKVHTMSILRYAEEIVTPTQLFLWGAATETGASIADALALRPLGNETFELYTKLTAGSEYKLTSGKDITTANNFILDAGKITVGNGGSTVSKTAVYRIYLDFKTKSAAVQEITTFSLYYSIHGAETIYIDYQGKGVWAGTGYVAFSKESWGLEDRYKFQMKLVENGIVSTRQWGAKNATDSPPSGDISYFQLVETDVDPWARIFKFAPSMDRKNVNVTVSLTGANYTHTLATTTLDATYWEKAADASTVSFLKGFWNSNGHFNNDTNGNFNPYGYWPEAHALDVVIDAYNRTKGDATKSADHELYRQRIYSFYEGVKAKNGGRFWNSYYDDMAWHGLAHLRAFEATGDARYEQSAKDLWAWIVVGWDETDGGGIRWNSADGTGKGVPTNGPATIIAVRRWVKYGDAENLRGENNLQWAKKIYAWMRTHRYVAETGRVYESLADKNGDWTYNAGTFMGAGMELYDVTHDRMYLDDAIRTADYAVANLLNFNTFILRDWAEQRDHDVNLFKAVFVRYFTRLIMHPDLPTAKRDVYVAFMKHNANYLWNIGSIRSPYILYSNAWSSRPKAVDTFLNAEISGAAMIEGIAILNKKGYVVR